MKRGLRVHPTSRAQSQMLERLSEEAVRLGLGRPVLISGGRHFKLVFEIDGKERFLPMPITPSDVRGELNLRTALRRLARTGEVRL